MSIEDVTALDATFLELEEADESAHMHIGSVALFEPGSGGGPPTLDQLRAKLVGVADDMPRFRQRLSQPRTGGLHWPQWVDDEAFDVANHVRQAGLPAPGGRARAARVGGRLLLVDGSTAPGRSGRSSSFSLGDGRWAMVSKTHHCMVDGVGSVDIGQALLDTEPDAPPPVVAPTGLDPELVPAPPAANSPLRAIGGATVAAGSSALGLARFGADVVRGAAAIATGAADAAVHPEHAREAWDRGAGAGRCPGRRRGGRRTGHQPQPADRRARAASPWSRSRSTT